MFSKLLEPFVQSFTDYKNKLSLSSNSKQQQAVQKIIDLTQTFQQLSESEEPLLDRQPRHALPSYQPYKALSSEQQDIIHQYEDVFLAYLEQAGSLTSKKVHTLFHSNALFWYSDRCMHHLQNHHVLSRSQWHSAYEMLCNNEVFNRWSDTAVHVVLLKHLAHLETTLHTVIHKQQASEHMQHCLTLPQPQFTYLNHSQLPLATDSFPTPKDSFYTFKPPTFSHHLHQQMHTLLPLLLHPRVQPLWQQIFSQCAHVHYALIVHLEYHKKQSNQQPCESFLAHYGTHTRLQEFINTPYVGFLLKKYLLQSFNAPNFCNWYFSQGPYTTHTHTSLIAKPLSVWDRFKTQNTPLESLETAEPLNQNQNQPLCALSERFALLHFLKHHYDIWIDPDLAAIYAAQRTDVFDVQSALYLGANPQRPIAQTFMFNHNPLNWQSAQVYDHVLNQIGNDKLIDQAFLELNLQVTTPLLVATYLPEAWIGDFFMYLQRSRTQLSVHSWRQGTITQTAPLIPLYNHKGLLSSCLSTQLLSSQEVESKISRWTEQLLSKIPQKITSLEKYQKHSKSSVTPTFIEELLTHSAAVQLVDFCAFQYFYNYALLSAPKGTALPRSLLPPSIKPIDVQRLVSASHTPFTTQIFSYIERHYLSQSHEHIQTTAMGTKRSFKRL